jgi:citrate synthase
LLYNIVNLDSIINITMKKRFLTAREAAAELNISLATLYAYVSRGVIRSEAAGDNSRARRYSAEDIERLKARKAARHNPDATAEGALHLGTPVLESAITLIADGRLYYRGQDAVGLAEQHSLEEVAALIWGDDAGVPVVFEPFEPAAPFRTIQAQVAHLPAFDQFQIVLPLLGADDLAAYDLRSEAVWQTGARILGALAWIAAGGKAAVEGTIADTLSAAWGKPAAARLVNAALVLCADHELNISAFTARCVASAGATPYAVVQAGLAALGGPKHGGHTQRVEALLREAGDARGMYAAMADRLRRGEPIPGFGHPLYPEGDPRGAALLRWITEAYPDSDATALAEAGREAAARLMGDAPTIDFALSILGRALDLPTGAPLTLFAIGRTVGWIGHAIEQYALDRLIRPRARYIGNLPAAED